MKFTHLLTAMCCAMSLVSCGKEKQTDLFDYSDPVDLAAILQTYDWYQHDEAVLHHGCYERSPERQMV